MNSAADWFTQSNEAERSRAGAFLTIERVPRRSDLPPRGFIPTAMHLAMVPSAQRHGKLIADLATESPSLGNAQMMRIRRLRPRMRHGCLAQTGQSEAIHSPMNGPGRWLG